MDRSGSCRAPALPTPKYAVGLDFGTTFSGFAFARKTSTGVGEDVKIVQDWPIFSDAVNPYCKTTTALWYVLKDKKWVAKDWGWPAVQRYAAADANPKNYKPGFFKKKPEEKYKSEVGMLVTQFKLRLADEPPDHISHLPPGITVDMAIQDYLCFMAKFILKKVKEDLKVELLLTDIEWAITVPAMWSNKAKQRMKDIAKSAGMSESGLENVHIVLEPEAAAVYCNHKKDINLEIGDRFLILDAGGGTVDIVVLEKVGEEGQVKQVTKSEGSLCGAATLDSFLGEDLEKKTHCYEETILKHPSVEFKVLKKWDDMKKTFTGVETKYLELPLKLKEAWKEKSSNEEDHGIIEYKKEDMERLMKPVIDEIVNLTAGELHKAGKCKAILLVGGFSQSDYLYECVSSKLGRLVKRTIRPPNPGIAICQGALLQILHPNEVISRISRKTYGMKATTLFKEGTHKTSFVTRDGERRCYVFSKFVKIGESVSASTPKTKKLNPTETGQKKLQIEIFSTLSEDPDYVDEDGVQREGCFEVDISNTSGEKEREFVVSLWFGQANIKVEFKGTNYGYRDITEVFKFKPDSVDEVSAGVSGLSLKR